MYSVNKVEIQKYMSAFGCDCLIYHDEPLIAVKGWEFCDKL